MNHENMNAVSLAQAGLVAAPEGVEELFARGVYHVQCVGAGGEVKWEAECPNVVTTEGKNAILDKFLGLGAAYAGIAMGLHTTVGNAASTYAAPSPQVEPGTGVYAARLAPSFSSASAGAKATSAAVAFSILGTATITGCFLVLGGTGILTNGNTAATAILLSSGSFGASRSVINGDTLNVSYSLAL